MYRLFRRLDKTLQIVFLSVQTQIGRAEYVRVSVFYKPESIFPQQVYLLPFYKHLAESVKIRRNGHLDTAHRIIDCRDRAHIDCCVTVNGQLVEQILHRLLLVLAAFLHAVAKSVLYGKLRLDCRDILSVLIVDINVRHRVPVDPDHFHPLLLRI